MPTSTSSCCALDDRVSGEVSSSGLRRWAGHEERRCIPALSYIRYAVTRGSRGSLKADLHMAGKTTYPENRDPTADGACQQGCGRAWWLRRLGDPGPELLVEPFAGLVTRQVHDLAQPPLTPRRTTQRDAPIPGGD